LDVKILITGGSGFIGTNLVQYYLDKNIIVLNIDIKKPRNINHINYYRRVDICDKRELVDCMLEFRPSHIIHLAARTDLDGSSLDDYKANTLGVSNMLEAISSVDSIVKTIFASSMLVCKAGYKPVNYNDYKPTTIYGESKVASEEYIKANLAINSNWNIIRPTSIWGPWFGTPYRNFFDLIVKNRYVNIKVTAANKTFGFVGNAVFQINELLFSQDRSLDRKSFYIGDNPCVNISEWANEILRALGRKPAIEFPLYLFKSLAYFGDLMGFIGVKFPMNSFRLRNMTTNNIQNLDDLYDNIGPPPFSREEGIKLTLNWMITDR